MKKFSKIMSVFAGSMLMASVAFAQISQDEACQIFKNQFPDAEITRVECEWDDGREIYEIKFRNSYTYDGECEIDAATGRILKVDMD